MGLWWFVLLTAVFHWDAAHGRVCEDLRRVDAVHWLPESHLPADCRAWTSESHLQPQLSLWRWLWQVWFFFFLLFLRLLTFKPSNPKSTYAPKPLCKLGLCRLLCTVSRNHRDFLHVFHWWLFSLLFVCWMNSAPWSCWTGTMRFGTWQRASLFALTHRSPVLLTQPGQLRPTCLQPPRLTSSYACSPTHPRCRPPTCPPTQRLTPPRCCLLTPPLSCHPKHQAVVPLTKPWTPASLPPLLRCPSTRPPTPQILCPRARCQSCSPMQSCGTAQHTTQWTLKTSRTLCLSLSMQFRNVFCCWPHMESQWESTTRPPVLCVHVPFIAPPVTHYTTASCITNVRSSTSSLTLSHIYILKWGHLYAFIY